MRKIPYIRSLLLVLTLVGCTTLPQQGPSTNKIVEQSKANDFLLIAVNAPVSQILSHRRLSGFGSEFLSAANDPSSDLVAIGDKLQIQIFEAQGGSLFAQGSDSGARFQSVPVSRDGSISIPFAGDIQVVGLTTKQIEERIVNSLENLAIQPQALVKIASSEVNAVTITGAIAQSGQQAITVGDNRLIDVLSKRGGSRHSAYETKVSVTRGNREASAVLSDIFESPKQNIKLQRGDLVVLSHEPKFVSVSGSVNKVGNSRLRSTDVSLLDILGDAGGLSDARADRGGVFLFRFETPHVINHMGIAEINQITRVNGKVPTVYQIDFSDANAQFYAQSFLIRPDDSIYVANSDSVQLGKFLSVLGLGFDAIESAVDIETEIN